MNPSEQLDFSSFKSFHTVRAVAFGILQTLKSWRLWLLIISVIVIGAIINPQSYDSRESLSAVSGLVLIFAIAGVYFHHYNFYTSNSLVRFARLNKLRTRKAEDSSLPFSFLNPEEIRSSRLVRLEPLVELSVNGRQWDMFVVEHVNHGKYVIFQTDARKGLPNIAIDNVDSRGLPSRPSGLEAVKLEGPFHKMFTVYFPKGAQSIALSAIDPVFMEVLMENLDFGDIEVSGDRLSVVAYQSVLASEQLPSVIDSLGKLEKLALQKPGPR